MSVPPVKTQVIVLSAETPTITVKGIRSQAVDEYDLMHGVHVFPDLIIDATTKTEHNERKHNVCLSIIVDSMWDPGSSRRDLVHFVAGLHTRTPA